MMKPILLIIVLFAFSSTARGQIHTEKVDYTIGGATFEGYLAYKEPVNEKRPAILVFHEWWGMTPYIQKRVEQLADLGYIAFAADVYGKGVSAATPPEAMKLASPFYTDRKSARERAEAGLAILMKNPHVDKRHIAAIGYCFGGMVALELARDGADLAGVVTFHGTLATPNTADARNIKGKVLVLTGGDDPNVPPAQVSAFEDEMRKANVDWEVVSYGGAVHAFTNPAAGNDPSKGMAYNERADRRSWNAMKDFFAEIFK